MMVPKTDFNLKIIVMIKIEYLTKQVLVLIRQGRCKKTDGSSYIRKRSRLLVVGFSYTKNIF